MFQLLPNCDISQEQESRENFVSKFYPKWELFLLTAQTKNNGKIQKKKKINRQN